MKPKDDQFSMVVEHYKQDLREYWTKANFYFVANTGLLSVFLIYFDRTNQFSLFRVVPVIGIILSAFFFRVLDDSNFWNKIWRCEVLKQCNKCGKFESYDEVEEIGRKKPLRHPEFWTQLLSLAFIFVWIWFLVTINIDGVQTNPLAMGLVSSNVGWTATLSAYIFYQKQKHPTEEEQKILDQVDELRRLRKNQRFKQTALA